MDWGEQKDPFLLYSGFHNGKKSPPHKRKYKKNKNKNKNGKEEYPLLRVERRQLRRDPSAPVSSLDVEAAVPESLH